jgi:transposase
LGRKRRRPPFPRRELAWEQELLAEVDRKIQALLEPTPEAGILRERPGVGPQLAAAVLALVPPHQWAGPRRPPPTPG